MNGAMLKIFDGLNIDKYKGNRLFLSFRHSFDDEMMKIIDCLNIDKYSPINYFQHFDIYLKFRNLN